MVLLHFASSEKEPGMSMCATFVVRTAKAGSHDRPTHTAVSRTSVIHCTEIMRVTTSLSALLFLSAGSGASPILFSFAGVCGLTASAACSAAVWVFVQLQLSYMMALLFSSGHCHGNSRLRTRDILGAVCSGPTCRRNTGMWNITQANLQL